MRLMSKSDASVRDSLIFSATEPVSYSFACHVTVVKLGTLGR